MMYRFLLLTILLFTSHIVVAQQNKVVVRFINADNLKALANVTIIDKSGTHIAKTDTSGYAVFPLSLLQSADYLIAFCPGFEPDTMREPVTTVRMMPLEVTLGETTVQANKTNKLLHAPNEYVVDYCFTDDNILTATYSGENGGHAKLFLLDKAGNILASCKIPYEPLALFKSCMGMCYCVCSDRFYPVRISDKKLQLLNPYDIGLLQGLEQCEHAVKGNLYYKLADRDNFRIQYGMIRTGDTVFHPITTFEENDVALASYYEWWDIQTLLAQGQFSEAARKQFARAKWDKGSFAHIDMPLVIRDDTLAIFDFFKKQILLFDLSGKAVGNAPVQFEWKQYQRFSILKDDAADKIYLYRYDKQNVQTMQQLDIHRGVTTGNKIIISEPFAEDVKVYNGDIYFLWQDKAAEATRQLFIQRTDMK